MGRNRLQREAKKRLQNHDELGEMFNQMMGEGPPDLKVIGPKLEKLQSLYNRYLTVFENLAKSQFFRDFPEYSQWKDELITFTTRHRELIKKLTTTDVAKTYNDLKNGALKNTIIKTLNRLVTYKSSLSDTKNLSYRFVYDTAGSDLCPLTFTNLDLKQIYGDDRLDDKGRDYFLTLLGVTYQLSYEVYQLITSPDIDIDKFSEAIVSSISELEKHMPRCGKAIRRIRESVDLLKNNFGNYYKDFVDSRDPTIMIQNFVVDVSQDQEVDLQLTWQFKHIISHYKKAAQQRNANDPKMNKMLDMLQENFDIIESHAKESGEGGNDESQQEESDSDSDDPDVISAKPGKNVSSTNEEISEQLPPEIMQELEGKGKNARRKILRKYRDELNEQDE